MTQRLFFSSLTAIALCAGLLSGCGGGEEATDDAGPALMDGAAMAAKLSLMPFDTPDATESQSLAFMREEEKLAHDVYSNLDGLWGNQVKIFGNIATSEANHTEAVRQLLLRYNLSDPVNGSVAGSFVNTDLQNLFDTLTTSGQSDINAALAVGMQVEELDIRDIAQAMQNIDNEDILFVYAELLKGSRNHLRSFYKTMQQRGLNYTPQYISQEEFNAIVNSAMERG